MDYPPPSFPNHGKLIPDAYHGTSKSVADTIAVSRMFRTSKGPKHFCGEGVYFWEGSLEEAQNWARDHFPTPIGVICSKLELRQCLDLCAIEVVKELHRFREYVQASLKRKVNPSQAIAMLAEIAEADTVRFPQRHPNSRIFDSWRFGADIRLIICVRNLACITSMHYVYNGK